MKSSATLGKISKPFWLVIGIILIAGIGLSDYLTGYEISFSLFYLIPIALLSWFAGRCFGIAASVISAFVWYLAEISAGKSYSHQVIYLWNSTVRFSFFIIVTLLLDANSKILKREQLLSSTDFLTGAVNARVFNEVLQGEIDRAQRYKHPFTLVYLDIDNFKQVNDQYGHSVGDRVLNRVVDQAKQLLRKTDTVVRLGGDEFAFLMPETDQTAAKSVLRRVHQGLLGEMGQHGWPVTFSIGVLTFKEPPASADEAIKLADDLMYSVKNNQKNAVEFSEYSG